VKPPTDAKANAEVPQARTSDGALEDAAMTFETLKKFLLASVAAGGMSVMASGEAKAGDVPRPSVAQRIQTVRTKMLAAEAALRHGAAGPHGTHLTSPWVNFWTNLWSNWNNFWTNWGNWNNWWRNF